MPIIAGGIAGLAVLGAVGYTFVQKVQQNQAAATQDAAASDKTKGSKTPGFLSTTSTIDDFTGPTPKPQPKEDPPPANAGPANPQTTNSGGLTVDEQARSQAWQAYYADLAQKVAAHNQLEQQARGGNMDPLSGSGGGSAQIPGMSIGNQPPENQQTGNPLPGTAGADGTAPYSMGGVNPAGQTGKQAFLRTPGDVYGKDEDVPGSVHGPKPNTIMEGTGIPYRLVEGATSDMPGQLNAEIMQNVYDSMTGDVLLIPQGTKIVGTYDIAVSAGQERLGIIWNRLIFPDSSSRQIGSMSGADQAGLAGMADTVDHHFWEKFGSALMVSLIGAGAQLAQPQQSSFATPSSTSAATGAMTQQLSQFGIAQAQQNSAIPNTIELRPGLIGLIKANKDLTLPPYVDKRLNQRSGNSSITLGKFVQ